MISVNYHDDLKEVQSDGALSWLLSDKVQTAPFDRLEWWSLLAQHCALKPLLVVARDSSDTVVLPLAGGGVHLTQLSNWYTFRFRPILSPGADSAALLLAMADSLAGRTSRITLHGLPEADADLIARSFRSDGWIALCAQCDVNHVLALEGRDFEAFLAGRPGRLRTTLKRKSGKVRTQVLPYFDDALWSAYEDIYAESWKPEEGSPAFLRAFARAEGAAGRLRLAVANDLDGRAVAAQMWTVEGGTAFIHKLAHRESAKALSPGSVLSAALFRHVIDVDKVDMVDFGTGDDAYKRDWMEQVRPRCRLDLIRPRSPRNWPILIRHAAASLAARAKRG
ncbi:GNAT family N-acetyltransferase [Novosphingobium sp. M1R2S20]|uniref:GNAT family N-acetyltransferase n=1 Tax=Novosphingobium rhizovicinum TaxID=3228928 RepID=A0ABV3RFT9_9SPHN